MTKRNQYYPSNAAKIESKTLPVVMYVYTFDGSGKFAGQTRWCAVGFHGQQQKPSYWQSGATREDALAKAERWWKGAEQVEAAKAQDKADRAARRHAPAPEIYVPGTFVYTSWGYDQTNLDFYKVVARNGMSATVVKVAAKSAGEHGWMCGSALPTDHEIGDPIKVRITKYNGEERCKVNGQNAWLHDGQPHYWSSYA